MAEAHTIDAEHVGERPPVGGSDEFKIIREDLEAVADLVDGMVALVVVASEAGEGESMAALHDHVQHLRLQVRRQTDRVDIIEGGAIAD